MNEKLLLKDILPELTEILNSHPNAEITAYEGEGGASICVEEGEFFKSFHTRSR